MTKKTNTPVVDLTNIKTANDVYSEFAKAKVKVGEPISSTELKAHAKTNYVGGILNLSLIDTVIGALVNTLKEGEKIVINEFGNVKVTKPNIFVKAYLAVKKFFNKKK